MFRVASKSLLLMSISSPLPLLSLRLSRHSTVSLARFSAPLTRRLASAKPRTRLGFGFSIRASEQIHTQVDVREDYAEPNGGGFSANSRVSHPWPEWEKFLEILCSGGYSDREMAVASPDEDDAFSVFEDLPAEFVRAANACLCFARDRPDLLSSLSQKDIEVVVENGSAFLFKNGMDSTRRLRSFLGGNGSNVELVRATTVDVMRFLLSYACNPLIASVSPNLNNRELVETAVRNLLNELSHMTRPVQKPGLSEPMPKFSDGYGQSPRNFRQNIEMKRGDWICPKCSFMNFARNMKCLDCNEPRPKRQLTGGEWECPQCNFFNYGRNAVCLRCDCKRPGENPFGASGPGSGSAYGQTLNGTNSKKSDSESRLAANDEKAERWFSKVSQMDNMADSTVADEDFPEIMPLRKGVNRFVVSTRKTPLERRLENAQYRRNLGNNGSPEVGNDFQAGNMGAATSDNTAESSISESLDRILRRSSAVSETNKSVPEKTDSPSATGTEQRFTSSQYRQSIGSQRSDSGYVPFVPLPSDMFAKPQNSNTERESDNSDSVSTKAGEFSPDSVPRGSSAGTSRDNLLTPNQEIPTESDREKEQAEKSERWFKKVAELHDVTDLASAISDEDFPEIMPMRKGENRFVVSKKKDRSLTSPQYKRRMAMEQSNSSNFVPFVPFPPDYFAKKDKQPENGVPTEKASSETLFPEKVPDMPKKPETSNIGSVNFDNQQTNTYQRSAGFPANNLNENKVDAAYRGPAVNSAQQSNNLRTNPGVSWSSGLSGKERTGGSSTQQSENTQNRQFTGKSLEGSLVKEPDPLDMSEEAKAERWFRRVAQIKDISELSQIPDEDFPSIMPMRKGVNRFVVSKRKTPLERRLTSPQYRRNLPIVSSEPTEKKDA
eukprot:TRINITY_DN402_c2_g1_i1.p1 TRINITY_DN402_c2_g1~~TRINITY_DN402_c2_g1_i1.p1  ORF type:complete len:891 (-),score=182.09 TRINITY_DN402_c2_g1_i1:722-3394(-)